MEKEARLLKRHDVVMRNGEPAIVMFDAVTTGWTNVIVYLAFMSTRGRESEQAFKFSKFEVLWEAPAP